ncbi:hypothetical protein C8R31_102168 [Nitrosospira sp. Nsp2]|nr:hypothetical protein C8R31_102168 [Nitrosospira sp. Nsp2]
MCAGAQKIILRKSNVKAVQYFCDFQPKTTIKETLMNSIIWWVGLIVVIIAVLSFLGLR